MSRNVDHKPPFPYFGGKSPVADLVWDALGDVPNYVEPFFGSGAVLFLRPGGAGHIETVNDADGFVANFWQAGMLVDGHRPNNAAFIAAARNFLTTETIRELIALLNQKGT